MPTETTFKNLIPHPRSLTLQTRRIRMPVRLRMTPAPDADADWLARRILAPWVKAAGARLNVRFSVDPEFRPRTRERLSPAILDQAYRLEIGRGVHIAARSAAGLRHALQSLCQLLEDAADAGLLPELVIEDWPKLAWRGIHVDLAREMEYRPAHFLKIVEHLAYLKMNTLHVYIENKFAYPSAPEVAPPNVMTPGQARALCAYARRFGITVIPQIATLGHMEHLLHGKHADMREDPASPWNLCPTHPGARPFLAGLIADVAAAFASPFIHVGYDESHSGVCERCRRHGSPGDLLADHLNWLNAEVRKHGARTMIYGDKFLSREDFPLADAANGGSARDARATLAKVSRDILITDWHYTAPWSGTLQYLVREGFEVHMANATNLYWHDSIPLNRGHHWIVETVNAAIRNGATGAFNCNWEQYRGQFFDNYWFFQGLEAERAWTTRPHDYAAWGPRFARRFWGVEPDYYSELAGLAEAVPTARRRFFTDSSVLSVEIPAALNPLFPDWRQVTFDHPETGQYMIDQAARFRKAARRNRDTLRILDMPGQIARYLGVRARQRVFFDGACKRGDRKAALACLSTIRQAVLQMTNRLRDGYRVYGGAVEDRHRIASHLGEIDQFIAIVKRVSVSELRALNADSLILLSQEEPEANTHFLRAYSASPLLPAKTGIRSAPLPGRTVAFTRIPYRGEAMLGSVLDVHAGKDGLVYVKAAFRGPRAGRGRLLYGADGPVKVWINGRAADCRPEATNPAVADEYSAPARWKAGRNEVLFALRTNRGKAWGVIARYTMADG